MELSLLLTKSIMSMAVMILIGYAATKAGLLTYEISASISTLVLYIIAPCMFISCYQIPFTGEKLVELGIGIIGALVAHALFIGLSWLLGKKTSLGNIDQAALVYTNAGNLIVPLVASVLGDEYVFYTSAFLTVQIFLIWSHCLKLVSPSSRINLKKIILNPSILATVFGFILFVSSITLPDVLASSISKLSNCIGPMSMVGIGIIMAQFPLKKVFASPKAWIVSILRLIIYPLILVILIWITGITRIVPLSQTVLFATILAASAPTGVTVPQFARIFDGDAETASIINVMTTILCIVTMPLIVMAYQFLCI